MGGKIEYESLMRAISEPLPRPTATRSLRRLGYQAAHLVRIALYIAAARTSPSSSASAVHHPPPKALLPIFDVTGKRDPLSRPCFSKGIRAFLLSRGDTDRRPLEPAWKSLYEVDVVSEGFIIFGIRLASRFRIASVDFVTGR